MPEYRRLFVPGGTYFFTVVTYHRSPILTAEASRSILRQAWKNVEKRAPFTTNALCLLPDHLHCIWTLPNNDSSYSERWKEIKRIFSRNFSQITQTSEQLSPSQQKRKETTIWQRRFWEHTIRDENDLERHLDYIHYNPVKHGLVTQVKDWQWSSFHRYVKMGYYDADWGGKCDDNIEISCGE